MNSDTTASEGGTPNPAATPSGTTARWQIPDWFRRIGLASWFFLGIVTAVALLAVIIAATSEITAPLVLGAFLAIAFVPMVDWLADHRMSRGLASFAVLVGLGLALFGVGWLTGAALVDQADELSSNLDKAMADIEGWLQNTPIDEQLVDELRSTTGDAGPALNGGIASRAISIVDSAFGFVAGTVLGTIVFYYLIKDGPRLVDERIAAADDADARRLYERISARTVSNVQDYFKGRTAMAVANGAAIGVAAAVLGVPAAAAIAIVNFFGAYIPYLGAFVGGAFAVLMALGEGGIGLALVVLGIALAVNLLLENLLEPVLLGDSLNLHPLLILLATSLGGIVAGMIGLVLAAPALAIAIDIERELKRSGFFDDPG